MLPLRVRVSPRAITMMEYSVFPIVPSDCLVSYLGNSLEASYPSAVMQSMYSTAAGKWVGKTLGVSSQLFLRRQYRKLKAI